MYTEEYSNYNGISDNGEKSKFNIARCNRLVEEAKNEIEDLNYKLKLYELDRINTIKYSVTYYKIFGLDNLYIPHAKKWLEMSKGKYDKRKNYPEKSFFEMLQENISKELFNNKEINIINFSQMGYEGYGDIIYLDCEGLQFEITAPMFNRITIENFKDAFEGKIAVFIQTGKNYWKCINADYDESVIADSIKALFEDEDLIKEIKEKLETT